MSGEMNRVSHSKRLYQIGLDHVKKSDQTTRQIK